ncbi:hypothetical protein HC248_00085 [Polaromonas vacuolata]|uniref:Uncharacterized protein n=1 Tax=Polaromonas vacuolata TaxID=37448 RepID=A0A6H2H4U4_9BURK|nr:hypothetical protein HC248_00085 [Polaromonas vacuolata]
MGLGTAKAAFPMRPSVLGALKLDIARITGKARGNRMRAIGVL